MTPLQSIPANVRTTLYWIGYVAGVLGQGITLVWGAIATASPDVTMPLGLVIASAVLGLLQTQLNLLAGSNVTDARTVAVQAPAEANTTVTAEVDLTAGDGSGEPHRTY
jgi:hypothetical protein